jgi:hypothetical protein
MRPMSINGRGPVGPSINFPGDTPAERYTWLMTHMSDAERRHMAAEKELRRAWLLENNPEALRAA